MIDIDYPLRFNSLGATAAATPEKHIHDMIEQLLFTSPGERVNRPDFGSGLMQLVFAPNSAELAAALQFTLQAALQRWLGDLILVQNLHIVCDDATLSIDLQYTLRSTNQSVAIQFTRMV